MTVIDLKEYRKAKIIEKLKDSLRKARTMEWLGQLIRENKATPGQIKLYRQLREYFKNVYPHLTLPKDARPDTQT